MCKIAICYNEKNTLCDLLSARHITVFQRESGHWRPIQELCWQVVDSAPAALRVTLRALAAELNDCKILLCTKISGIAYQELTRSGIALFEADALSDGPLDQILQDVLAHSAPDDAQPDVPKSPVCANGDGHYTFDLIAAQMSDPELSSKRALRGFLEKQDFLSLELICDHLPPWAEDVIARRGMSHTMQRRPQAGICITIIGKA